MKKLIYLLVILVAMSFTIPWQPSFAKATQQAKASQKHILLNFSGSDWCGPCIRLHKEIFDTKVFLDMADSNLLMVNADFPRNKKNKPSKVIQAQNAQLAERYNPQGKFPFTLLLDENGKIVKVWDGLPEMKASAFAAEVSKICSFKK